MTLIEIVRHARELGFPWIAIDASGIPWFYDSEPHATDITQDFWTFRGDRCKSVEGEYNLTCDWRKAVIEVNKITETGE